MSEEPFPCPEGGPTSSPSMNFDHLQVFRFIMPVEATLAEHRRVLVPRTLIVGGNVSHDVQVVRKGE